MRTEQFDLLAAKMQELKRMHERELTRALFYEDQPRPIRPLTRRERLSLKLARVRRYCSTLWDALKGHDPYDDWDGCY